MEMKAALPPLPVVILVVVLINATWAYAVFGVAAVWWGGGFALLTRDIRRARRAERVSSSSLSP
jgi:ABC-type dipeptide/oligopeptide/nickel transport system permease subunit